jgi:Family of unknown function (DUF5689)
MKNTMFNKLLASLLLATSIIISCNKKFDEPPAPSDPNITVTTTIKDLKAMHTVSGAYDDITTDIIISGIVVADDKSGNLYKSIYIQDATGAINVLLDANNLYTTYPVGRRVFIKCKGLVLSDYNRMIQLGIRSVVNGTTSQEAIPSSLIRNYVIGGSIGNVVNAKTVTISSISTSMQDENLGTLIKLDNYEVNAGDTSKTFADTSASKNSANIGVNNCARDGAVIIRTSGFSNFAGQKPKKGNGSLLAIYTVFGSTKQLLLRDTADMQFTNARCNAFEQDFETTSTGTLNLTGWRNIAEVGGVSYTANLFGGTRFAQVSAFNAAGNPAVVTSWLITPAISLTGLSAPVLSFQTIDGFNRGSDLSVLVSTNYNPTSNTPSTATWTPIATTIANPTVFAGPTASGYASSWKNSGNLSLTAFANQTIYLAFRYDGANPTTPTSARRTTTWQIDNIRVGR